jgi:hypothetical protein
VFFRAFLGSTPATAAPPKFKTILKSASYDRQILPTKTVPDSCPPLQGECRRFDPVSAHQIKYLCGCNWAVPTLCPPFPPSIRRCGPRKSALREAPPDRAQTRPSTSPLIACIISSREQRIGDHDSWPPGASLSGVTSGPIYRSSASRPVEADTAGATATRKPVRTQAR